MKQLQQVAIKDIKRNDKRFYFTAGEMPASAVKQTEMLFSIPVLWSYKGVWIPVVLPAEYDNYANTVIDAMVYSSDTSYEDVLRELLRAEEATRDLNIFDISCIIRRLEEYVPGYDKKVWSLRLGIGATQWQNIQLLQNYEAEWMQYFIKKHVPLKRVLIFSAMELRTQLKPLLVLNPGINVMESIAVLLQEIAHRDSNDIKICWDRCDLDVQLYNDNLSSAERINAIRTRLYRERYPAITEYQTKLHQHLDTFKLPSVLQLKTDPLFETPGLILNARLEKREHIDTLLNWLQISKAELEKIMDIQQGKETDEH